jgi:zinc/manganese transport system permease protein
LLLVALAVQWVARRSWLGHDAFFYAVFAVVASVAVPALGLFLVFASLIAPALWIERGLNPWTAMMLACVFCLIGLCVSWVMDTPSGPTIVMTLAIFGFGALGRRQSESPDGAAQSPDTARPSKTLE